MVCNIILYENLHYKRKQKTIDVFIEIFVGYIT